MSRAEATIEPVADEGQLQRILPLMRAYCDFYAVSPSDRSLLDMSRALMADPLREGRQLLATQDGTCRRGFGYRFAVLICDITHDRSPPS